MSSVSYTPPTPPSGLSWTCHPIFGVVHSSECNICSSYVKHVASANQLDVEKASLHLAIKERDGRSTIQYLDGVSAGISLGSQNFHSYGPADLLAKYRAERDEAFEIANLRTEELAAVQQELLNLREQYKALQASFDDATRSTAVVSPVYAPLFSTLDEAELCGNELSPLDATLPLPTPPPSPPPPPPLESLSHIPPITDISTPLVDDVNSPKISCPDSPTPDVPVVLQTLSSSAGSLQALVELMSDARNGHKDALLAVESIYAAAQFTPEEERTLFQEFILLEWGSDLPICGSIQLTRTSTPTKPIVPPDLATTSRFITEPKTQIQSSNNFNFNVARSRAPEIFVDSSMAWGIGFVLNGRWLAWKLKPGWQVDGRDNNWSEMVAVELGLRVIVHGGFSSQIVIVRSDNTGVVQALQKGGCKRPGPRQDIFKRIEKLKKEYGLVLQVRWISTKHNPADKPSRGKLPSVALRYPTTMELPKHLQPFLDDSFN